MAEPEAVVKDGKIVVRRLMTTQCVTVTRSVTEKCQTAARTTGPNVLALSMIQRSLQTTNTKSWTFQASQTMRMV